MVRPEPRERPELLVPQTVTQAPLVGLARQASLDPQARPALLVSLVVQATQVPLARQVFKVSLVSPVNLARLVLLGLPVPRLDRRVLLVSLELQDRLVDPVALVKLVLLDPKDRPALRLVKLEPQARLVLLVLLPLVSITSRT